MCQLPLCVHPAILWQLGQLRQLPGVGETLCVRLGGSHIITLVDLARAPSGKVDTIAGRKHPFGHGTSYRWLLLLLLLLM